VRAPFDGIVSDRKVSAGDTAQIGKELVKVIDPASLRFEGFVSADSIGEVRTGSTSGSASTVSTSASSRAWSRASNPAANITTRQVEVLVGFDDAKQQPNVAGLYAEGRIETRSAASLALPSASVVREGDKTFAWRVKRR
jgi:pyruvate/2-oxoglutarate dehydrogenase complex dihydrolipoamide acyltransferase (E2) component